MSEWPQHTLPLYVLIFFFAECFSPAGALSGTSPRTLFPVQLVSRAARTTAHTHTRTPSHTVAHTPRAILDSAPQRLIKQFTYGVSL